MLTFIEKVKRELDPYDYKYNFVQHLDDFCIGKIDRTTMEEEVFHTIGQYPHRLNMFGDILKLYEEEGPGFLSTKEQDNSSEEYM